MGRVTKNQLTETVKDVHRNKEYASSFSYYLDILEVTSYYMWSDGKYTLVGWLNKYKRANCGPRT